MTKQAMSLMRGAAHHFKKLLNPNALVLLYHRVVELDTDPWSLSVTTGHFDDHLDVLSRRARPVRLQQLVRALRDHSLPRRSVVITFDDGYADNLHNAKAKLERYDVPATFFLTAGLIDRNREFWWDELDQLLLQTGTLPATLSLKVNGATRLWELGNAACYSETDFLLHRGWSASEKPPTARHLLYHSLWKLLKPMLEDERRDVFDELWAWAGTMPDCRPTHRPLTSKEALTLDDSDLVEIGAHTVTHPSLSNLPIAFQRNEIRGSKARLEAILNHSIKSFSYPYGGAHDFSAETVDLVQRSGFESACSTSAQSVTGSADRFQLPRITVKDWNGEEFTRFLSSWLHG